VGEWRARPCSVSVGDAPCVHARISLSRQSLYAFPRGELLSFMPRTLPSSEYPTWRLSARPSGARDALWHFVFPVHSNAVMPHPPLESLRSSMPCGRGKLSPHAGSGSGADASHFPHERALTLLETQKLS
jgi:hypothetical protein